MSNLLMVKYAAFPPVEHDAKTMEVARRELGRCLCIVRHPSHRR